MTDRPAGSCLTHRPPRSGQSWRRADGGYRTCASCAERLHRWLSPLAVDDAGRPTSIPGLFALLDPTPGVGPDTGRRGPGFSSRSPAKDRTIAMRDRRSWVAEPGDPQSAQQVLGVWVRYVREERYDQPGYGARRGALPASVEDAAVWLDRQLDWITRRGIVEDFHRQLGELHAQLRTATDGPPPGPVAHCTRPRDGVECGAPIFMPRRTPPKAPDESVRYLPVVACPECGEKYSGADIMRLKLASERQAG